MWRANLIYMWLWSHRRTDKSAKVCGARMVKLCFLDLVPKNVFKDMNSTVVWVLSVKIWFISIWQTAEERLKTTKEEQVNCSAVENIMLFYLWNKKKKKRQTTFVKQFYCCNNSLLSKMTWTATETVDSNIKINSYSMRF